MPLMYSQATNAEHKGGGKNSLGLSLNNRFISVI